MSTNPPKPLVGVSALILNSDAKILTGKRMGSHGAGTIQFPGGHLDHEENFFECAQRETHEETGLKVRAVQHLATTNDVFEEANKHYITIFVLCKLVDENDQPQTLEPEKGFKRARRETIFADRESSEAGNVSRRFEDQGENMVFTTWAVWLEYMDNASADNECGGDILVSSRLTTDEKVDVSPLIAQLRRDIAT
ncbi:hypothetical protein FANTH_13686 [Fusarium anthophilum]|uniref:Nudix hydrolase domain-containing protein n=1 Tax=Fusarium anthophilum TaxID=48485 RepID=A0A8H5DP84_9HYPO|nr:hypothetical protein FANTH_13686 [Fusarium anthophilum]